MKSAPIDRISVMGAACLAVLRANVKPQVLRWTRTSAGFSIEVAAKRVPVDVSKLIEWESGESQPTLGQLRKLADVYRRPLAVMYLESPPRDFQASSLPDFRRPTGGVRSDVSIELTLEIRQASQRRQLALDLMADLDEANSKFSLRSNLSEEPEEVARRIRRHLGAEDTPLGEWSPDKTGRSAFNWWRQAIEAVGALVFQMTKPSSAEVSGFALAEDILPVLAINRRDSAKRRSFSLLHELVHATHLR